MGSEWYETTIGELCKKVVTGGTPLTSNEKFFKDAIIPWLKTKEVNFCKIYETDNRISEIALRHSSAKLIPVNSVIVAMYGQGDTAGRVAINKIPLTTNQACCNLIIDETKADYQFVYFFLKHSYTELVRRKSGSAQPNLNTGIVKAFEITVPPIQTQKKIAHILGSLDDKIELNRQMNATLESMAQALFKSWFVDFDPVIDNALAAGDPIPEPLHARAESRKALGDKRKPLPEAIQKQFPSRFVFSEEMGWIPEGWEINSISQLAHLNPEAWTAKDHPEMVNYVDLANVKNGRISERVSYRYIEAPSRAKRVLRIDDTIIGTVRPGNQSFTLIVPEKGLNPRLSGG